MMLMVVFALTLSLVTGQTADWQTRYNELNKKVDALATQIMLQQQFLEEKTRTEGSSGIKQLRHFREGTRPYHSNTHSGSSILSMHNHANLDRTPGMGEFIAVLNGLEFRTRHNDYKVVMPHTKSMNYHSTESIPFPDLPPQVVAKKTIDDQIKELREFYKAWAQSNSTHRDYRNYFRPALCYLEGAWNVNSKTINEPFASDRHFIDATTWFELFEKARFTAYTGRKDVAENYAFLPTAILEMRNGTLPVFAQWSYRILCHPVKRHIPLSFFRPVDDVHLRIPYKHRTDQMPSQRYTRFQLDPRGNSWKNGDGFTTRETGFLDEIMAEIPGKNNYPGKITDEMFGYPVYSRTATPKNPGEPLNTAYYHRWYKIKAGNNYHLKLRSGSDTTVFMAQTTSPKVAPMRMSHCTGSGKYKKCKDYVQRWTYAVPLEIIWLHPLMKWNPYNLAIKSFRDNSIFSGGRNGGLTAAKAYNGTRLNGYYYLTPESFFAGSDSDDKDPADTAKDVVGVLDQKGNVRRVKASGVRITLPNIEGVGSLRQRYPIPPIFAEGNSAFKEVAALRDIVMERSKYSRIFIER
ncbi:uncharacterized protein LOC106178501 [Lingula anatina]|uniref:Uncharacterized protein LOC106178501 n=1 Tax=Lingula anatina TaxID=7574 RepID=A0A1S3K3F6_LINAN|nr:uncharacterized protein LOC106178501 [Lingula anatina]|eukprot:XP_013417163.1 uncharacterized protein LOC106178501 [Lingula anatina]